MSETGDRSLVMVSRRSSRFILKTLARWSTDALYAYQDADYATVIYDAHEALDKLDAPGPTELGLVERIDALRVQKDARGV